MQLDDVYSKALIIPSKKVLQEIYIGEFEKVGFHNELKFKLKSHILKIRRFVRKSFWTSVVSRPNLCKTYST